MAITVVEIERGLLTDAERKSPDWFPRWFTYTLTNSEQQDWIDFMAENPLEVGYDPEGGQHQALQRDLATQNQGPPNPPTAPTPPHPPPLAHPNQDIATPGRLTVALDSTAVMSVEPYDLSSNVDNSSTPPLPSGETLTPALLGGSSSLPSPPCTRSHQSGTSSPASSPSAFKQVKACHICILPPIIICQACESVFYCSEEHRVQDFKTHRKHCRSLGKAPLREI